MRNSLNGSAPNETVGHIKQQDQINKLLGVRQVSFTPIRDSGFDPGVSDNQIGNLFRIHLIDNLLFLT
jgi:hypothetical protein